MLLRMTAPLTFHSCHFHTRHPRVHSYSTCQLGALSDLLLGFRNVAWRCRQAWPNVRHSRTGSAQPCAATWTSRAVGVLGVPGALAVCFVGFLAVAIAVLLSLVGGPVGDSERPAAHGEDPHRSPADVSPGSARQADPPGIEPTLPGEDQWESKKPDHGAVDDDERRQQAQDQDDQKCKKRHVSSPQVGPGGEPGATPRVPVARWLVVDVVVRYPAGAGTRSLLLDSPPRRLLAPASVR